MRTQAGTAAVNSIWINVNPTRCRRVLIALCLQGGAAATVGDRPRLANGTASVDAGTPQISPAPAATQTVRRTLMGTVENADAALAVAAGDWRAAVAAADQEERLHFR